MAGVGIECHAVGYSGMLYRPPTQFSAFDRIHSDIGIGNGLEIGGGGIAKWGGSSNDFLPFFGGFGNTLGCSSRRRRGTEIGSDRDMTWQAINSMYFRLVFSGDMDVEDCE